MLGQLRWRPILGLLLVGAVTLGLPSFATGREKWGPFRGQVVDLETGQPIAGAVILAVWWEVVATPVEGKSRFYDAKEAVTGPDGRFEIPRLKAPFWKLGVQPAELTIFAPGYEWRSTLVTPPDGERFVAPTVVQMRPLKTREELLQKSRSRPASVPLEKMPELTRVINAEREMLGVGPLPVVTPREGSRP